MATTLQNRPTSPQDDQDNPTQAHYDREFDKIAQNYNKETAHPLGEQEAAAAQNPSPEKSESKAKTLEQLKNAEQSGDSKDGWYSPESKQKQDKKQPSRRGWLSSMLGSNRRRLIFAGGGAGIGVAIITFFMQFGPLLLPTLANNIDNNRFVRLTRQVAVNTEKIISLKLVLDSTGDEQYRQLIERYRADTSSRTGRFINKINALRPEKLVEQMAMNVEFKYQTKELPGGITRRKVTSINFLGTSGVTTIPIPQNNFNLLQRTVHPLQYIQSLMEAHKGHKSILHDVSRNLNPSDNVFMRMMRNLAVRKAVNSAKKTFNIRDLDVRWAKSDIEEADKNPPTREEARTKETQTSYAKATNNGQLAIAAAQGDAEAKEGAEKTDACVKDEDCLKRMIDSGDTIAPEARADLNKRMNPDSLPNTIGRVAGNVSNTVEVGVLLCMISDASIVVSEAVINAKSAGAVAMFGSLGAAAGQQVYTGQQESDSRINAALLGGFNDQINNGTVTESNVYRAANGDDYDTTNTASPHSAASGMFDSRPLSFLPTASAAAFMQLQEPSFIAEKIGIDVSFCDVVGSPWGASALLLTELAATAIPGIGQAGKVTAMTVAKAIVNVARSQLTKRALAENAALLSAAHLTSLLSQTIAEQRMGAYFNGLAQGADFINQADAGAEVMAQNAIAATTAGRPLTAQEYDLAERSDEDFRTQMARSQSFSDRYFAMDNPDSLIRQLGFVVYANLNANILTTIANSLIQRAANLFNPTSLLSAAMPGAAARAQQYSVTSRDYGVVQYGWTEDEENAFLYDPNYSEIYNEIALDQSGRADELSEKYSKCFGEKMGTLLAKNDIQRDGDGNVINGGLCSPENLGDSGPPNDGELTFKDSEAELMFRLRVSMRNNNAIDTLTSIQEAAESE